MSDKEQKAREEFVEAVIASLNSTEPVKQGTALKAVSKLYELYELQPPLVIWCESLWQLAVMPPLLEFMVEIGESESERIAERFTQPLWQRAWNNLRQQATDEIKTLREQRPYNLATFVDQNDPMSASGQWPSLGHQFNDMPHNREVFANVHARSHWWVSAESQGWSDLLERISREPSSLAKDQILGMLRAQSAVTSMDVELLDDLLPRFDDTMFGKQFADQLGPAANNWFSRTPFPGLLKAVVPFVQTTRCADSFGAMVRYALNLPLMTPTSKQLVFGFQASQGRSDDFRQEFCAEFLKLFRSVYAFFLFDNVCFLCERPTSVSFDDRGRLHSDTAEAIVFRDGYRFHAWHGVRVPAEIIHRPDFITVFSIETEGNAELRRVMIERYGRERYLFDSGAVLIDSDESGSLYRKELVNDEPLVMVQVLNSTAEPDGTFKKYFLRVPPETETVKEAVAWTFSMESSEYEPIVQT